MPEQTLEKDSIALVGGGTGGPTTPLLAIAEVIKKDHPEIRLIFIGTRHGPEKQMAQNIGLPFYPIFSAKLRRYFSLKNITDIFLLPVAFAQALILIWKNKIRVVVSAGSYAAVPVVWAAWLLRKKILIHQQDVQISLSTKLTSAFAHQLTLTFPEQKKYFPAGLVTGNPVRLNHTVLNRGLTAGRLNLNPDKPLVLIFGGGTGSKFINQITETAVPDLVGHHLQILHITGRSRENKPFLVKISPGYTRREFLDWPDMAAAYSLAQAVVCRAGLASISELSYLSKPAIVIPMPNTHQEKNAELLSEKNAAIILEEKNLSPQAYTEQVVNLIQNKELQDNLKKNIGSLMPHDAKFTIASLVYKLFANT